MPEPGVLIRHAGRSPLFAHDGADVRCRGPLIVEIGRALEPIAGERILDAHGGALLPGLNDQHIHLFATAAPRGSVDCSPDACVPLAERLVPGDGWLRGVNYHESLAGPLDRTVLDRLAPERPVRIQHATGSMWFLNSRAIELLQLDTEHHDGLERDRTGRLTGRLFRADDMLAAALSERTEQLAPDLRELAHELASRGVTRLTDATYRNDAKALQLLQQKQANGELALVNHLIAEHEIDGDELERLRALIRAREQREGR